ncbi:MAG: Na+/H+ antiporter NhaC family protein [Mycoplasmatales bacterium]
MLQDIANYEFMSIIPAIVAIVLAFRYKNVYMALGIGLYVGIVLLDLREGSNIIMSLLESIILLPVYLTNSMGDPGNAGIIMQVLLIGGLVVLLNYTGGLKAVANYLTRWAKSRKSAQFVTWACGLFIFFDDYANSLIVGPVMRPITDKNLISREKLSFIIDATAAPISGVALISTWIGFELSLISEQLTSLGITDTSAMGLFLGSIPFRFYNIFMLVFIFLTIYMSREFGPMFNAEVRAQKGEVKKKNSTQDNSHADSFMKQKEGYEAKLYEGLVPIIVLVVSAIILFYTSGYNTILNSGDTSLINAFNNAGVLENIATAFSNANTYIVLSQAAILAIMTSILLSGLRGCFKVGQAVDRTIDGTQTLLSTVFVLLFAWSIGTIMGEDGLNASAFISSALGSWIPAFLLPLVIFLTSAFMAFSIGTSFGTMGILFPLAVPLAWGVNPDVAFLTICIGAILTGTIVGDHCSPISDTTILSSSGADIDHLDHVTSQMPYAIFVGIVSAIGYLLAGLGLNIWLIFIMSIVSLILVLKFYGEKV